MIILNALQNAPSAVKDSDNKETEHDANKAAWESYKNLPGMLLCETFDDIWQYNVENLNWYSPVCFLKL